MTDLLLGVDIGTYSSKGVLVTLGGEVVKSHAVAHTMDIPRPGWAEQDADKVWWADFVQICRALLDGSPYSGADVLGVAVSAIGPCMLPLDKGGKPLRPGILYGVDGRATREIDELNKDLGEQEVFDFCGMSFTSQAVGPKILWMKKKRAQPLGKGGTYNHRKQLSGIPSNWRKGNRSPHRQPLYAPDGHTQSGVVRSFRCRFDRSWYAAPPGLER